MYAEWRSKSKEGLIRVPKEATTIPSYQVQDLNSMHGIKMLYRSLLKQRTFADDQCSSQAPVDERI